MTGFKCLCYLVSMCFQFFMANSSFCKIKSIRSAAVAKANILAVYSFKLLAQNLTQHFLCTGHKQGLKQDATAY